MSVGRRDRQQRRRRQDLPQLSATGTGSLRRSTICPDPRLSWVSTEEGVAGAGAGQLRPLRVAGLGQWAAWKASTTVFEIRPRSETWWPFCRAHARIAAVCSRSNG